MGCGERAQRRESGRERVKGKKGGERVRMKWKRQREKERESKGEERRRE